MKTLDNGCPQFDADKEDHFSGAEIDYLNTQLRKWHNSRRCLNCINFDLKNQGFGDEYCNYLKAEVEPTFSCQAFQEKK